MFKNFGLHYCDGGRWIYRDWVPDAEAVYLFGDFNGWNRTATPLVNAKDHADIWFRRIGAPFNAALTKGGEFRLHVVPNEGEPRDMIPVWATCFAFNPKTKTQNAVVWPPSIRRGPSSKSPPQSLELRGKRLHLYEFDLTLVAQPSEKPSLKFARSILPRAAHSGYHGVIVQGLYQAGSRSSTGSLLAASAGLGNSSDFPAFLQRAHELGLAVILELPSGADPAESSLPPWFFRSGDDAAVKTFLGRLMVVF